MRSPLAPIHVLRVLQQGLPALGCHRHLLLVHRLLLRGALVLHRILLHVHLLLHHLRVGVVVVVYLLWVHLLLRRHQEGVHVLRVPEVVLDDEGVQRRIAVALGPVLGVEEADLAGRLLVDLLQELILLVRPKVILILRVAAAHTTSLGELLLEGAALCLACGVRHDATSLEVVKHLAWDLFQSLLSEHHRIVLEVSERHKLHDIGSHLLPVALGVERDFVSVKLVHGAEISSAYTYDDYGKRQL